MLASALYTRRHAALAWLPVILLVLSVAAAAQSWRGDYPPFADYASAEARRIADNILSWQMDHGGWTKEVDFAQMAWQEGWPKSTQVYRGVELGSFDDGKTTAEIRFLALVFAATGDERYKEGVLKGLDFIFAAQYPSGGWPQAYPERGNYSDYVTFNDHAMVRVLHLLTEVANGNPPYDFVDLERRERAQAAIERGIDYILKSQIRDRGILTAWNQQHHPETYEPMPGRPYEPVAITAYESVAVVEFLMGLPDPSPEVREAILSALEWFERTRLPDGTWARFYEIGTDRPIFLGRDGIVRYSIHEIDEERQTGYAWYGTWPRGLLQAVRTSGYLDALYASLPERSVPRIEIAGPLAEPQPEVHGAVPVEIAVTLPDPSAVTEVAVHVDELLVYSAPAAPSGALTVDTAALPDGPHQLIVTVHTADGLQHVRRYNFRSVNGWTLTETFRPPDVSAWFGTVDYLQASERSDGWSYSSGDGAQFFGDGTRLVRSEDTAEHLVWETPYLRYVEVTLYVTDPAFAGAVSLELWANGSWRALSPTVDLQPGDPWSQAVLRARAEGSEAGSRLRLTVPASVPASALHLGHLELAGTLVQAE